MTLQIRPAKNSMRPFIDPGCTGGFESTNIERGPDIVMPRPKGFKMDGSCHEDL